MTAPRKRVFLFDSNVLIDYIPSYISIITLFSTHIGRCLILVDVLNEIDDLSKSSCRRIGMEIREPTTEQYQAARAKRMGLSEEDRLCLVVARELDYVCVTNDSKLLKACEQDGVEAIRGLRILVELCRKGVITVKRAEAVSADIVAENPQMSESVLRGFRANLKRIRRRGGSPRGKGR